MTALVLSAALLSGCEKDLEVYSDPTCRLNFTYENVENRSDFKSQYATDTYSFVYSGDSVERDTVWYDIQTMGFLSDEDRPVTLVQLDTAACNAQPGVHYVAFDDASLQSYYIIPAGKSTARLPIVLLRDATLKDTTVVLKFGIQSNEWFQNGYPEFQNRVLTFTDRLSEPSKWNAMYYPFPSFPTYGVSFADYFGVYGTVKHRFLIEQNGEKWDDDYIDKLMTGDQQYLSYLVTKMSKALEELNAQRESQGLDVLKEEDGTTVVIGSGY